MFDYIQDAGLKFTSPPRKRAATKGIVIHHKAGWGDVLNEHNDSLKRGWIGIGYNIYIRQDGTVWWGRGLDTIGAHAGRSVTSSKDYAAAIHNNDETIGIGFEGYYHSASGAHDKTMPAAQYNMGVRVIRDLLKAYPTIEFIKGHKEMPATATVCPGEYFPLSAMIKDATAPETVSELNADSFYCVQVGAYKKKANAENMLKAIKQAGFSGYIIVKDTAKKTYYDN